MQTRGYHNNNVVEGYEELRLFYYASPRNMVAETNMSKMTFVFLGMVFKRPSGSLGRVLVSLTSFCPGLDSRRKENGNWKAEDGLCQNALNPSVGFILGCFQLSILSNCIGRGRAMFLIECGVETRTSRDRHDTHP
jgi:hypothetical protein